MSFLLDPIVQWLQNLLVSGIMSNLSGLFDGINDRVMGIAGEVGAMPQAWNSSIFNMIRNLSENVVVPIAGIILNPNEHLADHPGSLHAADPHPCRYRLH